MTTRPQLGPAEALHELGLRRIVAVIRASSADAAVFAARALAAGGVTAIEITYTTPGAASAIRALVDSYPDLLVGAGTLTTASQAREAATARASFLVSPYICEPVLEVGVEHDTLAIPGVLTPTEIGLVRGRAPLLKVFPASFGGPRYLKALREPFPDLRLMPTGGVSVENVSEWLAAGAFAVAVGRDLCPSDSIEAADRDDLDRRARAFVAAAQREDG